MNSTTLVVGHGSRNPQGNEQIREFVRRWSASHPHRRLQLCFLELAHPGLAEGLDQAAQQGDRVQVLPLILNAAGHVKQELPEAVEQARQRHPGVRFEILPHIGAGPELLQLLRQRLKQLMAQLHHPDPRTTGVILLGRGSSDAGANGELARLARWLYEAESHDLVELAFTGVTWPRLEQVVQRMHRLDMTQLCILPLYLFTGVLIERIQGQLERLRRQYPQLAIACSEPFGFDPIIYGLAEQRVSQTNPNQPRLLECDGCRYRTQGHAHHHHHHQGAQ